MHKSIAVLFLLTVPASRVMAGVIPPIGLAPGSQYQLIFVTHDGRDATSANIADYNAFVQHEASLNSLLPSATWQAVASTATVGANVNAPSGGLPVYNTQGIEVVASEGLYNTGSPTQLLSAISFDQYGGLNQSKVWTGSIPEGNPYPLSELGATVNQPQVGLSYYADYGWIDYGSGAPGSVNLSFPLYALSSPITVPTPEPATISLLGSAVLMIGGGRLIRSRRRPA